MTRPVVLTEAAREDIAEARDWYRRRQRLLARDFLGSLRACLEDLGRSPERHPLVYHEVRRALLRRFPYTVLYVARADAVVVLGCFHGRRDPSRWKGRPER